MNKRNNVKKNNHEKNELDKMLEKKILNNIKKLDSNLFKSYRKKIHIDTNLTRQLVSFQANKKENKYRWYKFKEAFSGELVEYLLKKYKIPIGHILDPFAGIGTSLFMSSSLGYNTEGIELLPLGQKVVESRKIINISFTSTEVHRLEYWRKFKPWENSMGEKEINILKITKGAYNRETLSDIGKFLFQIELENENIEKILFFALLCVLESISFTSKDGQYLRWDFRAGRSNGKSNFKKGKILSFEQAITSKLDEIIFDIKNEGSFQKKLFDKYIPLKQGKIKLFNGSSLEILPKLVRSKYNAIFTSPPYCNRYDYTRTYALELAMLGVSESELSNLRQNMISCTVENRSKELLSIKKGWKKAINICDGNLLLQKILEYQLFKKEKKELNNNGIPRMVKGYFYEMACIIQESFRVLKKGGVFIMVNDNVKYAGISISVDLILSSIAENIGFKIENILVLPKGKGNSSQQMGDHGREVLRKCVYIWRK